MKKVFLLLISASLATASFSQNKTKDTTGKKPVNDTLDVKSDVKFLRVNGKLINTQAFTLQPVFLPKEMWDKVVTTLSECKQDHITGNELFQLIQVISKQSQ